jgi:hypothetical protein
MHSRATEYGDMEDNFQTIANLWDTWLMARYRRGQVQIDALDVAVMMNQLKVARIASNPKHEDNYIDGVGYLACAGEIASKQEANT